MRFPIRCLAGLLTLAVSMQACQNSSQSKEANASNSTNSATPEQIRALVKEAYAYGYPVVDNYRFLYGRSLDTSDGMYLAPVNVWGHEADVMKAGDKAVQTVNTETPYSRAILDFRAEPIVLSVPEIQADRYYSMQLIDLYTHNYAYVGTRTEGNKAAHYLLTGPDWKGPTPKGIKKVIPCETQMMTIIGRTQLFGPKDLPNVKKIQAGYKLQPLSSFLGTKAPEAPSYASFIKPLANAEAMKSDLDFFHQLNFALQFCPTHESEKALFEKWAAIGIAPGKTFDSTQWSAEQRAAFHAGIRDAWADFANLQKDANAGKVSSADIFGTRDELKNNYLYRWAGDVLGIYGNTAYEAIYPGYETDADGEALDASKHSYAVRIQPDSMPARAFWSITMYDIPNRLLVANELDRYVINKPMLSQLKKNADGSVTVYMQAKAPTKDKISNWLPTPNGPFFAVMRLYWPKEEALNGSWKQPPLVKQKN